jgi:hypothetical protein
MVSRFGFLQRDWPEVCCAAGHPRLLGSGDPQFEIAGMPNNQGTGFVDSSS